MHAILEELDKWLDKKIMEEVNIRLFIRELYEKYGEDTRLILGEESEDNSYSRAYAYGLVKEHIKEMERRRKEWRMILLNYTEAMTVNSSW